MISFGFECLRHVLDVLKVVLLNLFKRFEYVSLILWYTVFSAGGFSFFVLLGPSGPQ